MKTVVALLGTLAIAASVAAQTVTLPPAVANGFEGTSSTGTLWSSGASATGTGTAMRHQLFYGRDTLPGGVITITRLRFRANGTSTTTVLTGGTWSNVTIQMCTSATPVTAPSTTFANNLGGDLATVYAGNVTVASTAQAFPGIDYVDITLQNPFVYTGTGDLLIDISWAAGSWSLGTVQTVDYHIPAGTPAARLYSTTAGATTGSLNTSAGIVVKLDYVADPTAAAKAKHGKRCYDGTFYELFSPARDLDLSNSAIRMQPNAMGGYDVSAIPVAYVAPISTPFTAADDGISPAQTLPFAFPYVGGSTTQLRMVTNGFVWLDGTSTSTDFSPSASELLTLGPRLAPAWTDWNANPAGTGGGGTYHFDIDPSNTVVYCTWNGVGAFGWSAALGGPTASTFQAKLFADGSVEYHYLNVNNPYTPREMLVGIKPGAGTYADPLNRDLSALLPFSLDSSSAAGLLLDLSTRPILGTTPDLQMSNIPAGAAFTAALLGFGGLIAPVDLSGIGMTGCWNNMDLTGALNYGVALTGPSATLPLALPLDPSLVNAHVYLQAVSGVASANPLGLQTSNALDLGLGN